MILLLLSCLASFQAYPSARGKYQEPVTETGGLIFVRHTHEGSTTTAKEMRNETNTVIPVSMAYNREESLDFVCLNYAKQQINMLELQMNEVLNTKPFCMNETRHTRGRKLISNDRRLILAGIRTTLESELRKLQSEIPQLRAIHGTLAAAAAASITGGTVAAIFTAGLALIPAGAACSAASVQAASLMAEINELEKLVDHLRSRIASIDVELCS